MMCFLFLFFYSKTFKLSIRSYRWLNFAFFFSTSTNHHYEGNDLDWIWICIWNQSFSHSDNTTIFNEAELNNEKKNQEDSIRFSGLCLFFRCCCCHVFLLHFLHFFSSFFWYNLLHLFRPVIHRHKHTHFNQFLFNIKSYKILFFTQFNI